MDSQTQPSSSTHDSATGLGAFGPPPRPWCLHPEFWILLLLVATIYLPRLTLRPSRGEDSRRATIAREMLDTGNWIVPTQQHVPYLSRPPLHSWIIAGLSFITGDVDYLAIRLPSVFGVLGMVICVYAVGQMLVGRVGAFVGGAAMASMPQVIELGRVGETDAFFSFLVSASLLIWLAGYLRRWPRGLVWSLGYGLAALGTLAKGPQALPYFTGATWLFLIWRRDWRYLFSWGHLLGIAVFALIFGAWLVPFYHALGWPGLHEVATRDAHNQWDDTTPRQFIYQLITMPLRVGGSIAPWIFLFILYLFPAVRRTTRAIQPAIQFIIIALAVAWPTVWLSPTSQNRHFMPLYPVLALAIAIAVAAVPQATDDRRPAQWWRAFMGVISVIMLAIALALGSLVVPAVAAKLATALPRVEWAGKLRLSMPMAGLFLILTCILAATAQWASWKVDARHMRAGALAVALFMGMWMIGPMLSLDMDRAIDIRPAVAQLRTIIGKKTLVSYGHTDHLFAYYYRTYIPILDFPKTASDPNAQVEYFSFVSGKQGIADPHLPFAWQKIGQYCCDRELHKEPLVLVIVGRRTSSE